jgi:hypothetical protein
MVPEPVEGLSAHAEVLPILSKQDAYNKFWDIFYLAVS